LVPEKDAISGSHIREIADKKTAYNEGCLYMKLTYYRRSKKDRKKKKRKRERGRKRNIMTRMVLHDKNRRN